MLACCLMIGLAIVSHPPLEEQVPDYTARLATTPDSVELLTLRGCAYFQSHDFDHALADFERALAIAPQDGALLRHKAATLHAAGFPDSARSVLDALLHRSPSDADAHLLRAQIAMQQGRDDDGCRDLEAVLQIEQTPRPEVFIELADAYARLGQRNAQAETLARGCDRLGMLPLLLEPLCRTEISLGEFAHADASIARLEALIPGSFMPALLHAELQEAMSKSDAAHAAFAHVIDIIDNSSDFVRSNDLAREARAYAAEAVIRLTLHKDAQP